MNPWLSVVVPTAGQRHAGLLRTLESIRSQPWGEIVEALVVADTYALGNRLALQELRDAVEAKACRARWLEHDGGLHCYGQPQRSFGARAASGDWVAFSQDDNILAHDALRSIWEVVTHEAHPRPLFFRVRTFWGETIWREKVLYQSNIDADCLVLPRALASELSWGLRYEGDFDAAVAVMQAASGDVGWHEETIAIARPESVWWQ